MQKTCTQQWRALLLPLLFQKFNFIVTSNTISTSILRIWLCSYCQCCCFQRKNLLLSFILPLVFEGNLTGNIWVTLLERSLGNWVSTFIAGTINLTLKEAIFFIPYKTQIRNSSDIKTDDAQPNDKISTSKIFIWLNSKKSLFLQLHGFIISSVRRYMFL